MKKIKNSKKGQAAMEYLMTYGWALIAIVLVIAALFFIFQNLKGPEICQFQGAGFWCDKPPQAYLDNGNLKLALEVTNQLGHTVEIHKVVCTDASVEDIDESTLNGDAPSDKVPSGSSFTIEDLGCYDKNNDPISMAPNQQFKGNIIVWYNFVDDIKQDKHRTAVASISVTPYK